MRATDSSKANRASMITRGDKSSACAMNLLTIWNGGLERMHPHPTGSFVTVMKSAIKSRSP